MRFNKALLNNYLSMQTTLSHFSAEYPSLLKQARAAGLSLVPWLESKFSDTPDALEKNLQALGDYLNIPFLTDADIQPLNTRYDLVSYADCVRQKLLCVTWQDELAWIITDPLADQLLTQLSIKTTVPYLVLFAREAAIQARLRRDEAGIRAVDTLVTQQHDEHGQDQQDISLTSIAADSSPIIKLVNATIYDGWRIGASDIHYETTAQGLQVKCRLDGVLSPLQLVSGLESAEQMISRLKVMAELDIAERRIPQDGRFKLHMDGRAVDFRVSVMPSALGEDIVVRILDKKSVTRDGIISLESLGFSESAKHKIHQLAWEPHGMLLVTGPTGSGKTTTLYAVVNELHSQEDKIVTIEDPVEYNLPGVLQIPVNDKKGLTFARGLRSILRHDPDKILVGEIRDSETAQIAIQSALTGHLVLTTVHANNTFDVIGRFSHMGVDLYNFVSALNGVVAQRLIRQNCLHCQQPDPDIANWLSQLPEAGQIDKTALRKGVGCSHCRGTGYSGRTVIAEILMLDDALRELVIQRAPIRELKQYALAHGFENLRTRALHLVQQGQTTLAEFVRVVGVRGS